MLGVHCLHSIITCLAPPQTWKPEKYTSAVSYNNLLQLVGVFCQNISLCKMRNCESMCIYGTSKKNAKI